MEGDDLLVRRATPDDMAAIRAILAAHDEDPPVGGADIIGPYLRHCVQHARTRVAERAGEVVGYGSAVDTGVVRHLADLFVRPDVLGRGIGRHLLQEVMGDSVRRTTFASSDPRALPLYVRAGMWPLWPLLHMEGDPTRRGVSETRLATEPSDTVRLAALERSWTGADRAADHAFWASLPAAEAFVILDKGEPVAIACARARQRDAARVVRLVVRPDMDPVVPTLTGLRLGSRGGRVVVGMPGPSAVLPVLLAAGFRITGRSQFMASGGDLVDPARLLPDPGML